MVKIYTDFIVSSKISLDFASMKVSARIGHCLTKVVENVGAWLESKAHKR